MFAHVKWSFTWNSHLKFRMNFMWIELMGEIHVNCHSFEIYVNFTWISREKSNVKFTWFLKKNVFYISLNWSKHNIKTSFSIFFYQNFHVKFTWISCISSFWVKFTWKFSCEFHVIFTWISREQKLPVHVLHCRIFLYKHYMKI